MKHLFFVLLILGLLVSACTPAQVSTPVGTPAPVDLYVMTHDSFAVSQDVIASFQQENQITVHFVKSGDAGQLVNKAILTKDAPQEWTIRFCPEHWKGGFLNPTMPLD